MYQICAFRRCDFCLSGFVGFLVDSNFLIRISKSVTDNRNAILGAYLFNVALYDDVCILFI